MSGLYACVLSVGGEAPDSASMPRVLDVLFGFRPVAESDDAEAGMWMIELPEALAEELEREGYLEMRKLYADVEYTLDAEMP